MLADEHQFSLSLPTLFVRVGSQDPLLNPGPVAEGPPYPLGLTTVVFDSGTPLSVEVGVTSILAAGASEVERRSKAIATFFFIGMFPLFNLYLKRRPRASRRCSICRYAYFPEWRPASSISMRVM